MGHIFISYSHKDKSYVRKLREALQEEGFEVWIDDRIDYGIRWPQAIQAQLDSCSAFIAVVSENSNESEWVQNEVARAKRKGKPFFPLLLQGDPWITLETIQYVNVKDESLPPKGFYDNLRSVLSGKPGPFPTRPPVREPQKKTPWLGWGLGGILLIGVLLLLIYWFRKPEKPEIVLLPARAILTEMEIEVDGSLDDPAWSEAVTLTYASHPEENGLSTATARFLWDGEYLYVGFDVSDTQVETADLSIPWDGDSVSILVHDGGIAEYRQSVGAGQNDDKKYRLKAKTSLNNPLDTDTGYTVEMRIKWQDSPSLGRRLPIDLLSVDHDGNPGGPINEPTIFSKISWDGDQVITTAEGSLILVETAD